jgi:hypothetical protein
MIIATGLVVFSLLGQGSAPAVSATPVSQTTYVLKVSDESRALLRLVGRETLRSKYVLRSDLTFSYQQELGEQKTTSDGSFAVSQKDVIFSLAGDGGRAKRGQFLDDRILVDGLTYVKVTDNIAGLWTRQTPIGPDKSLRFRFNDKGRFWFTQGDKKDNISSEGLYKVEGDAVVLYFLKVDGEDAPQSMPPSKLSLAEDRSSFLTTSGQRYEKSEN